ncbi:MAG: MarR family transcriptional regulator [Actinobacteria bacterium]|nr:MarR family transcriptional regulator [Actinomycetota bacterium]
MSVDTVGEIERALVVLINRATAPRQDHVASETGVHLERAGYSVLGAISDHDGIRLKDLSGALGLDISTVSRHAQHLMKAGLVSRAPDPDDRRAAQVHLTTTGRETLERVRSSRRAALEQILRDWSAADRKQLSVQLQRFVEDVVSYADGAASSTRRTDA